MDGYRSIYLKYAITFFLLAAITTTSIPLITGNQQLPAEIFPVVTLFLLLIGVLTRTKEPLPATVTFLILAGFIIKSIYFFHVYNTVVSPFPDSFHYLSNLDRMQYIGLGLNEVSNLAGSLQFVHYYFMYGVMTIFGTSYSLYIANIFLFSLSSIMFYRIINVDFCKKIAVVSTIIFLCSSNMFLFTSHILKDSAVLFLIMLCLFMYRFSKRKYLVLIPLLLLFMTRIYSGAAMAAGIIFHLLFISKTPIKKKIASTLFCMVVLLVISTFSLSTNYVNIIRSFLSNNSISDFFFSPLISILKFYFSPSFVNLIVDKNAYLILFIDSFLAVLFFFAVFLFLLKFIHHKDVRQKMWIYVIPIFIHALALGIEYGGDSTRQRIGVFGFIILTYVVGMLYKPNKEAINKKRKRYRIVWAK